MGSISVENAMELLLNKAVSTEKTEQVSIYWSVGRILARDYTAVIDQPPFARSPLDGYAFHHSSYTGEASKENPLMLTVVEQVMAGDMPKAVVQKGEAVRIMTGAMIPQGADCIIRQEDTDAGEETVAIYKNVKEHGNVCDAGEDIAAGEPIAKKGDVVTPAILAVMAAQGFTEVLVMAPLKIGILITGSELIRQGEMLEPGKIYNSNGPMIAARLQEFGMDFAVKLTGDDKEKITEALISLTESCAAVITTGGVSVGQKDYLPVVLETAGADILFHGIAAKPGSPMLGALLRKKLIFALSGNPFAAMTTLELVALPAILKMTGRNAYYQRRGKAYLTTGFPKESKGRRFIRGYVNGMQVSLPKQHSSGSIASMNGCNCLIDVAAGTKPLAIGEKVDIVYLNNTFTSDAAWMENSQAVPLLEVPVLAVCGVHNAGKTTALAGIIKEMTKRGLTVCAMKHDAHDFCADVPGTDSYLLKEAGAVTVSIFSDKKQAIVSDVQSITTQQVIRDILTKSPRTPDIILYEGGKNSPYRKIEIVREETGLLPVAENGELLAIMTDRKDILQEQADLPLIYDINDIIGITDYIISAIQI